MKRNKLSNARNIRGKSKKCSLEKIRLHKSLVTITYLIEEGNESLWPIFEKLENELIRLNKREDRLSQYSRSGKLV